MLIAFVPVLHTGYLELFQQHEGAVLGILGPEIITAFTSLTRDCRTIAPERMRALVTSLGIFSDVQVLSFADIERIAASKIPIAMPDEDVSHALAEKYGLAPSYASVFLRWDKMPTQRENIIAPHRVITEDALAQQFIRRATAEAQKSADWWRQVGTVIVRDGKVLANTHNHHLPSDFHLAYRGDPRTNFDAGERIDISTALHSEATAIALCARNGISLQGAEAFVTTFPCPNCARLLAEAGIKKVYYHKGYSLLDAEEILRSYGIEIVLVLLSDTRE